MRTRYTRVYNPSPRRDRQAPQASFQRSTTRSTSSSSSSPFFDTASPRFERESGTNPFPFVLSRDIRAGESEKSRRPDIKYGLKGGASAKSPKAFVSLSEPRAENSVFEAQPDTGVQETKLPSFVQRPVGKISFDPSATVFPCQRVNSHLYP